MSQSDLTPEDKQIALIRFYEVINAMIDYNIEQGVKNNESDSIMDIYKNMKEGLEENYRKGRLSKLRNWYRDIAEPFVATMDTEINKYIFDKTGHKANLFESFQKRVLRIIDTGKIKTENQYYDVKEMLDSFSEDIHREQVEVFNRLIREYEERIMKKRKR